MFDPSTKAHLWAALAIVPPFDCLTQQQWQDLEQSDSVRFLTFEKGAPIHLQQEPCMYLDVILDGQVSIQNIGESGDVLTVNLFAPRDLLGVNLIFASKNRYPMTVIADRKSLVAQIPGEWIMAFCRENPAFMTGVMRAISDRSLVLTGRIQAMAHRSIRKALLDYLEYEKVLQGSWTIHLPVSKKTLAEQLGVERTSLSRELAKMRDDGLLQFDSRTITLLSS
ncbi:MAG: Crp/Fnr family transcriptional regulator [Clostridia bacterium]|nr:Crp/Fnr family transcriptional regulator [Clostridia bacterium]NCC75734.1 Crp/Fnr family transcriptional regulator [Clostridia bacterium]